MKNTAAVLRSTSLLNVVDLVVLPLLVTCDLPLRLLHQVAHTADLCALPHGVLHRLGQRQSGLPDPLVQPPVDCRTNTPIRQCGCVWYQVDQQWATYSHPT